MSMERRAHPRYPVSIGVSCATSYRTIEATSKDISRGGIFLHTRSPEPIETRVYLEIRVPTGKRIGVDAQVVHHLQGIGMGLQFLSFEEDGLEVLTQLLDELKDPAE